MKRLVIGILAHVDAGKTTLSEGLLYSAGVIDKLGRVDKKNAFLDNFSLERERGITIFSKQARISFGDTEITLIDTPGHIDFSCEAERALSIQDYAVLVVSAVEGIQSHTKTLWQLLKNRKIPTFIFVNKTDISEKTRREIMDELKSSLSQRCVDFSSQSDPLDAHSVGEGTASSFFESVASVDEKLMGEFFEKGELSGESISSAISARRVFPCYFGSALKMTGVREFLLGLSKYTEKINYTERFFGAKIYKIARDTQGKRLAYMKITGAKLSAKDVIEYRDENGDIIREKAEEIRLYSGEKYKSVKEALPGSVCAVLGTSKTMPGMGLGIEKSDITTLTPVLDYTLILPKGVSEYEAYLKFITLGEEDPALSLSYDTKTKEIRVRLMGEIQLEVLKRVIEERFGIKVGFGEGKILYKETVKSSVYGAGHFEPLRHYAEVHLLLEPLPEGSGIVCESACSTDLLALNWQRLILTHIEEKQHKGVLTGSPITDIKITLTAGKAHLKHTEGGDFRQATYRAIRQGLMKAESVLLEPTFNFKIELPRECLGRAINDITNMHGTSNPPEFFEDKAIIIGNCPVYTMRSYATELRAYTRGEGKLSLSVGPYLPCHNSEQVISERAYNPELDERNTPNSVFCKGGVGYAVAWNEADALMHIGANDGSESKITEERAFKAQKVTYSGTLEEDKELMRIFENTYGKIKPRVISEKTENSAPKAETKERKPKPPKKGESYVIIDGYNFIFGVEEFRKAADVDISLARDTLIRLMCDYSSFKKCKVIIVFDAYKRKGGEGSSERCGDVTVIYTKEAETADTVIERTTHDMSGEHTVRVVSSDMQEQFIVLGSGGLRVSAKEFFAEMNTTAKEIKEIIDTLK